MEKLRSLVRLLETVRTTLPLSKVRVASLKYKQVVQAPFKILPTILEEESYGN